MTFSSCNLIINHVFKIRTKDRFIKRAYGCVDPVPFSFSQVDSIAFYPNTNPYRDLEIYRVDSIASLTLKEEHSYVVSKDIFSGAFDNTHAYTGGIIDGKFPFLAVGYLNNGNKAYFIFDRKAYSFMRLINGGCQYDSTLIQLMDTSIAHRNFHFQHID